MNRKLINGLLLLTVTTGGVGMFTSCKDNEDSFRNEILKGQAELAKLLEQKIAEEIAAGNFAKASDLEVVKNKLNALAGKNLLTDQNEKYLEDLIKNNENYAAALKLYLDNIVLNLITSVEIQEVYNPAFGSLNLPMGIESTLLTNYYYQADHSVKFPMVESTAIVYGEKEAQEALDQSGLTPKKSVELTTEIQPIDRLGEIYVTVNPSTVPADALEGLTISLKKSNGEQVLGELKAVKENDHVINMGYTRADVNNGFYRLDVSATPEQVPTIALTIDEGLKTALKNFANDPSKSDLANLAEAVYKQFNNKVPALGLEFQAQLPVSFVYDKIEGTNPGYVNIDAITVEDGKYVINGNSNQDNYTSQTVEIPAENPILRSVYSKYAIAAVTYHPLAFSFDPEGYVPDRRLPQVGHIQEYVNRILDEFNFDLGLTGIDKDKYNFTLNLKDVNFEIGATEIKINLEGTPVYKADSDGNPILGDANVVGVLGPEANIVLGYDPNAAEPIDEADMSTALNPLIDMIVKAVNGDGTPDSGFKGQIAKAVNDQILSQLDQMIDDLNGQISGVQNKIDDKIASIKDRIDNELNGKLGDGINKLIDLYNVLAKKINNILDDPNAYLQVYAAYADGNGDLHQFSNVATDPSIFTPGSGDAIEMFLTSYNAELLAPAYKKYVAVVEDLTDGSDVSGINAKGDYLNTVLEGRQQRVYLPVGNGGLQAGHTYKVVYTALDYRGYVSARNFYIRVK